MRHRQDIAPQREQLALSLHRAPAEAIADALAFRRERRRLFTGAADNGTRAEIRKGLATYTGIAGWANSPADAHRAAAAARRRRLVFRREFRSRVRTAYGVNHKFAK